MSDVVWQALIAGLVTIILAVIQIVGQFLSASRVAQIRRDLRENTETTNDTKNIVNGQREVMLARIDVLEAQLRVFTKRSTLEEDPHEGLRSK